MSRTKNITPYNTKEFQHMTESQMEMDFLTYMGTTRDKPVSPDENRPDQNYGEPEPILGKDCHDPNDSIRTPYGGMLSADNAAQVGQSSDRTCMALLK